MTAEQRFERHLSTILEDLYLGPAPDVSRRGHGDCRAFAPATVVDLPRKVASHG